MSFLFTHLLKFMTKKLTAAGHEVVAAEDGLYALDILKQFRPDIMFIDLVMPNISGDKLCQIIRNRPEFNNCFDKSF